MPFAAAASEHPLATHAVGEVVGSILDAGLEGPDLGVLFVTGPHAGAVDDIADAVRATLAPAHLVGATAVSVIGGRREVEERPAVSLWAARGIGSTRPVTLDAVSAPGGFVVEGMPTEIDGSLLLLADPFSFPTDSLLAEMSESVPNVTVFGGLASAAAGPGGNRLVVDGEVRDQGAVGVVFGEDAVSGAVVSQGCRPIGEAMTVTAAEGNTISELAGEPAMDRLRSVVEALGPEDQALARSGLHIGRVIDEHRDAFERGDFLIRAVLGADPGAGSVRVGDVPEIGSVVQFQVRDADAADEDLRALLADRSGDAALVFTCNGRGARFFDTADHDAALVHDRVDGGATAGMFCAGEIGPIGGRNFVHGYTASVALFSDGS